MFFSLSHFTGSSIWPGTPPPPPEIIGAAASRIYHSLPARQPDLTAASRIGDGGAAEGSTWYHHPDHQTFAIDPTLSCSQRTCRHSLFEEVHLTFSSDLRMVLKAVNSSCINIILWLTVPVVDHLLREEVKTTITATAILHQFPRVSTCNRILSPFKESLRTLPWNRRQLLYHFEHFYNVCSVLLSSSDHWPQSKFFKPGFIWQFLEMSEHASKLGLDLLRICLSFT